MRIQYVKEDDSGVVVDLPEATAKRLIASGAAVEVSEDEPVTEREPAAETVKPSRVAKKTGRGKK
jgi:hypothetical protein